MLLLIQEFEKLPILWNAKHPEYYSKILKNDAWQELLEKINDENMGIDTVELQNFLFQLTCTL